MGTRPRILKIHPINKIYDVAIIGAGPAGSSLGYRLSQNGYQGIILEKEVFPRKKLCAGGLPAKVLEVIPFDIHPVVENEVIKVTLSYKLQNDFKKSYNKVLIYTVDRQNFDDFFVKQAIKAGIDFLEGEKVERITLSNNIFYIGTTNKQIKSKILVGADGARSFVAQAFDFKPIDIYHLGLQAEFSKKYIKGFLGDWNKTIYLDWGSIKNGYAWIFPKKKSISVGVQGPASSGKFLRDYFTRNIHRLGISNSEVELKAHLIPHRLSKRNIFKNNVYLIGDAAGLTDYLTGEGIYYALKSAEFAATQINNHFKGKINSNVSYENLVNKYILPELITSYNFSRIFNYIAPMAFSILRDYPYPWDTFCRIMRGDRKLLDIKKRLRPDILLKKLFLISQRGKEI